METGILAAVGASKTNNDVDVEVIQRLLNRVPPAQGGATPRLAEDGDCGPKTIAAIRKFQQTALGFQDGVVDPFKATHRKLIDIAGNAEDVPIRRELAERFVPRVEPMVARASNALNVLRQNAATPGPEADRTREALKVHFRLDDAQDFQAGRVMSRMDTIRIDLPAREIFWSEATIKQAKIELNEPKTVRLPEIYLTFKRRNPIVFTPNYKLFDGNDSLGFGPQMLAYTLIVGMARKAVGHEGNKAILHSDTPGYPGRDFEEALANPAAFAGFAFQLQMGFALPLGNSTRQL